MGTKRVGLARTEALIENLKRDLALGGSTVSGVKDKIVSITAATRTLTAAESGTVFSFNKADGITVTLPTAAAGLTYKFVVGTTFTSAGKINTAATDELYVGGLMLVDPATATDMNFFAADVSNDDTIDLGSVEQGWLVGGTITLVGLSSTRWHVEGTLLGDATLATPFE
jgi:hypothetical protein|tara:strand:+ start:31 stop:540 length:510 start_codon:yes stop_codon:yes gene_type:complete